MNWVLYLRLMNLVLIGLSVGFSISLYWNVEAAISNSGYLRRAHLLYMMAFTTLAIGAMVELEHAVADGKGANWRTWVLTVAALVSTAASGWCWAHWQQIVEEMKHGVQRRR